MSELPAETPTLDEIEATLDEELPSYEIERPDPSEDQDWVMVDTGKFGARVQVDDGDISVSSEITSPWIHFPVVLSIPLTGILPGLIVFGIVYATCMRPVGNETQEVVDVHFGPT